MRPCTPQPKYGLWTMSGAMILRISSFSSVTRIVGMTPSVVPEFGSVPIYGTGMNGASCGSIQRVIAWYHFLGLAGFFVDCCGPCAPSFSLGTPPGAIGPGWPGAGGGDAGVVGAPGTTCASSKGALATAALTAHGETRATDKADKAPARTKARVKPLVVLTRTTARNTEAAGRYPPRTDCPWWKRETASTIGRFGRRKSQIPRPSTHHAASD